MAKVDKATPDSTQAGSDSQTDKSKQPHASSNPNLNLVGIARDAGEADGKPKKPAVEPHALVFDNPFEPAAEKGSEKGAERTAPADLPPGSVERLHKDITGVLAERQKQFDVAKVQKQISDLWDDGITRRDLDFAAFKAGIRYESSQLQNPERMRHQLSGHPDVLKKYEEYWQHHQKIQVLEDSVRNEMTTRRKAIADIVNREASSLFPGGVVPKVELDSVQPGSQINGSMNMGSGKMSVQDSFIAGSSGKQLTRLVIHELKHAEQSGLIIRKAIDDAIPTQSTDQSLTADRRTQISERFRLVTGNALKPEILDQIFAQRDGHRLTVDENQRADGLVTSLKQYRDAPSLDVIRNRIRDVKDYLEMLHESPGLSTLDLDQNPDLGSPESLRHMFGGNVPPEITAAIEKAAKSGGSAKMPQAELDEFAGLLTAELEKQLKTDEAASTSEFRAYTEWTHEAEAWKVAQETDERLNPPDSGAMRMMQAIFGPRALAKNPENVAAIERFEFAQLLEGGPTGKAFKYAAKLISGEAGAMTDPAARERIERKLLEWAGQDQTLLDGCKDVIHEIRDLGATDWKDTADGKAFEEELARAGEHSFGPTGDSEQIQITAPDGTARKPEAILEPLKKDKRLTDDEKRTLDEPAMQHEIISRLSRAGKGVVPLAIVAAVALQVLRRNNAEEPYTLPSN